MTLLSVVYASAPVSEVIISTLEISHPAFDTIRICDGFEDQTVTLENDEVVTFTAAGLDISLPGKDTSGQQILNFAIDNVTGQAQRSLDDAIEQGGQITVVCRLYLSSDLTTLAQNPITMALVGASFDAGVVQLQGAYFNIIDTAFPRDRYTAEFAPGLKYIG